MLLKKKVLGTTAYLGGLPANLEAFTWAWGQLIQYNNEYLCQPGEIVHLDKATVSLHDFARDSLVERMLGDWLWMTDTDHAFSPDIVVRMLSAMQKYDLKVATAIYRHKSAPGMPVIYQWDDEGKFALPIGNWDQDVQAIEIGSAGAGCLMVRREVFRRIRDELKERPFARFDGYGEDHAFFQRCRRLKIPVYALTKIESPHLQVQKLVMDNYNFNNSAIGERRETGGFI